MALSEQETKYVGDIGRAESPDDETFRDFHFSEKSIRMGFIRKVYMILTAQLAVTMAVVAIFTYEENTRKWVSNPDNQWFMWTAIAGSFVCIIALACCGEVRRRFPTNVIFLSIFTICESLLLGVIGSLAEGQAVAMAAGITMVVAISLTIFAFQTRWDFTMMGGALFVFLIILLVFGFLCAIFRNYYADLAYASLGALLFSVYLVYDTQLMIGGDHKYSISPEEYIFAALNLYLDIINLFLYILMIIQRARQ